MNAEPFHKKLRRLRLDAGMTQGDLGAAVGATKQTVCHWERGYTVPNYDSAHNIRRTLPGIGDVPSPRFRIPARGCRRTDIDAEQLATLEAISQKHGVPVLGLLRVAVDRFLASL